VSLQDQLDQVAVHPGVSKAWVRDHATRRKSKRRYRDATPWTGFVRVHDRSGEVWRNSRYFVEVTRIPVEALDVPVIHLQIESNDHRPIHNWRDFQRIKTEILGEEEEALELYPAESCLVDDRNAYHLWSISGSNNFLTRLLGWGKSEDDNA
jgi:hypothetical protein